MTRFRPEGHSCSQMSGPRDICGNMQADGPDGVAICDIRDKVWRRPLNMAAGRRP